MTITVDTGNISIMTPAANKASPTTFSHTCGANVKLLVVVITIFDTSASDGVVSAVTYNGANMADATLYYDSLCDGHVSIWWLAGPDTGSSYTVEMTHGGIVTDIEAAAVGVNGTVGSFALDAAGTPATGTTGDLIITWDAVASASISFAAALDDQADQAKVTCQETEIYQVDFGDNVAAEYAIRSSSGSQTMTVTDADGDEDWVIVGAGFKEVAAPPPIISLSTANITAAGQAITIDPGAPVGIFFTNLGASTNPDINDNTDATSYANTSWTPPTDGIIIVFVHSRRSGGPDTPTISGNSLTWTQIGSQLIDGDGDGALTFFLANASGAAAGVTTIDFGANTQVHCSATFFQATGVDISGGLASAVVQQPTGSGTDTSGSVSLSPAGDSANRPIVCFHHLVEEVTTPRANWTEADDLQGAARVRGVETQYRGDQFETTASATWATSSKWVGMAAELKAEAGITISLVTAAMTANGQTLALAPGEATTLLDTGAVVASGQAISMLMGEATLLFDTALLQANGQALSFLMGEATTLLDTALLTANGQVIIVAIGGGPLTVPLDTALLQANGQTLALAPGEATTLLDTALLQANGQAVSLLMGEATVPFDTANLIADGQVLSLLMGEATIGLSTALLTANGQVITINIGLIIPLDTATLTANGQALTLAPGAVSTGLNTAILNANGQLITITLAGTPQSILLDTAILTATGQALGLVPGEATIGLSTAGIMANGQPIILVTGAVSIGLTTAQLIANGKVIVIVVGVLHPQIYTVALLANLFPNIDLNANPFPDIDLNANIFPDIDLDANIFPNIDLDANPSPDVEVKSG